MYTISITHDGKRYDFNTDDLMTQMRALRNRARELGAIPRVAHGPRRLPLERERADAQTACDKLEIELEQTVGALAVEVFTTGMRVANLSDGKPVHCPGCFKGFDTPHEVAAHAAEPGNETCQAALAAKLAE